MNDLNLYLCEHFGVDSIEEALSLGEITEDKVREATKEYIDYQYK